MYFQKTILCLRKGDVNGVRLKCIIYYMLIAVIPMYESQLGQRKTGRRAKRRMERESSKNDPSIIETNLTTTTQYYGSVPDPKIQEQIEAAILKRSQNGTDGRVFPCQVKDDTTTEVITTCTSNDDYLVKSLKETSIITSTKSSYEYLDHTADIQLHAWGETFSDAISQISLAMFGYMTIPSTINIDNSFSKEVASEIHANGHDLKSLVFSFLDEWLFLFHTTGFLAKEISIIKFDREK